MKKPTIIFFYILFPLIGIITLFSSCDECHGLDCPPPGAPLEVRYSQNGQNAIFGPNAFINRNSVTFIDIDQNGDPGDFMFIEKDSLIRIYLLSNHSYVLNLGDSRTDTFQQLTYLQPRGRCCPVTIALEVQMNGNLVCHENCEEVIGVEL